MHLRSSSRARAALAYAECGWHVFPCVGKVPATRQGVNDATVDADRVRLWWTTNPSFNVGIACGPTGLLVVDVDPRSGGMATYMGLLESGWDFPETRTQITPSGGFHLFYVMPERPLGNRAGGLHGYPDPTPGIDVRGAGGYAVVPPSSRELGRYYQWIRTWPRIPVPAPAWMSQTARTKPATAPIRRTRPVTSKYVEAALRNETTSVRRSSQGNRNHQLNTSVFAVWRFVVDGQLSAELVRTEFIRAGLDAGLDLREISRTIDSAAQGRLNV